MLLFQTSVAKRLVPPPKIVVSVLSSFRHFSTKDASEEDGEKEKDDVIYTVPAKTRKMYKDAIKEQRRLWYNEEMERRRSISKGDDVERERIAKEKLLQKAKKKEEALANTEREERLRVAQEQIYRAKLRKSIALAEQKRAQRIECQERLIKELEDESKYWMTTEEDVDNKITDTLWMNPGSTGLVTRDSHSLWRYVIDFERIKEAPLNYNDDPRTTLFPTNEDYEKGRVASITERLLRSQATTLDEFYELLKDANEISEQIKVPVVEQKKRPFIRRGPERGGGVK